MRQPRLGVPKRNACTLAVTSHDSQAPFVVPLPTLPSLVLFEESGRLFQVIEFSFQLPFKR
ncbi:hypothetical protein COT57_02960 [Candidatus Micrarchaeota archaeon CG09_land_8_20_14_0_10_55_25]|nr:MAG: hypothetical protein AUJ15_03740 [Candidatus Micrarchaeota archaeon CG1_02_55_41]PIO02640.1 MAG: hypothetical protein COT57_02960 [Candidatus Micrarchaeota archaeon CG09_land_8_20_14_0_10_55_25]